MIRDTERFCYACNCHPCICNRFDVVRDPSGNMLIDLSCSVCGYVECRCVHCSICSRAIINCTCFCDMCGQMKCRCDEMDCYFCGTELMMDWDVLDDNADLIETINMCPNLRCNNNKYKYKNVVVGR